MSDMKRSGMELLHCGLDNSITYPAQRSVRRGWQNVIIRENKVGAKMKRFPSIKKNSDFQTVYRSGKSYANRQLVMYVKRTSSEDRRIGISVSKKVGNSVVRHHLTRLIRESFRLHQDMLETGLDIVVVARAAAKESEYRTIERAFLHLCGLHNILRESK